MLTPVRVPDCASGNGLKNSLGCSRINIFCRLMSRRPVSQELVRGIGDALCIKEFDSPVLHKSLL